MTDCKIKKYKKYKYKGCIHIHSLFSDGSESVETISKLAKKAGISWIIVTDHNYFDLNEGIFNGVYVLKGEEISPDDSNHYLALGINKLIEPDENPQVYIDEVRKQNGIGFAAHPDESEKRKNGYPPIKWDKKFIPDGVEIWNWFSIWGDKLNSKNIFTQAFSYLLKNKLFNEPVKDSLTWWDELNNGNKSVVPAIGGVDAHALKIKKYLFPVVVFPYKTMFRTVNNVLILDSPLSKDFKIAKQQILNAIKQGNNTIVNCKISRKIPSVEISNSTKTVCCGEALTLDKKTYLNVEVGKKALIKIILNGREFYKCFADKCNLLLTQIGKYRVEIFVNKKGFAYSNPIVVM